MKSNKTTPTNESVEAFLASVSKARRIEAQTLIAMMQEISGTQPLMWGPSIVGFGLMHYRYETGREGDMPILAFSPRKTSVTIYFEGFDAYGEMLERLGKHTIGRACLYVSKLTDIDLDVLRDMLRQSFTSSVSPRAKPTSVEEYISRIPAPARSAFNELRELIRDTLPNAQEVVSYGIIGYKIDDKRARVYISGWNDHVAIYPIPHDTALQSQLTPFIRGKGTIWFSLDDPLPRSLIVAVVKALSL